LAAVQFEEKQAVKMVVDSRKIFEVPSRLGAAGYAVLMARDKTISRTIL